MTSNERTSVQVTLLTLLSAAAYFDEPLDWKALAILAACIFGLRVLSIILEVFEG